jgi:hypothetical protein
VKSKPIILNGDEYWKCPRCVRWFTSEGFNKSNRSRNGLRSHCKKCHSITSNIGRKPQTRQYRRECHYRQKLNPVSRERMRRCSRDSSRKRDTSSPQYKAVVALNKAVNKDKVLRPENCSECGKSGIIHGHHADYSKPLEVEWLCPLCHKRRHRESEYKI